MLLLNNGRDKDKERRRRMGVTYEDWTPQDHYGPYMPPYYGGGDMEPESAFYDRDGRRHYDNGRYAPMSAYGEPESARRYRRYSDGRFAPRSGYMPMEPWYEGGEGARMEQGGGYGGGRGGSRGGDRGGRSGPRSYGGDSPRMIGFARDWNDQDMRSDATMPQYQEMDYMRGQRGQGGMAYSDWLAPFDRRMAMEWTQGMENADGTKGPHWTMEQTTDAMKKHGVSLDPVEFWAVMNSLYSDYCEALKKNNASTMETYVCLAKAWIEDDDAVKDKAAAYFTYIVEH